MSLPRNTKEYLQFQSGNRVELCESNNDASRIKIKGVSRLKGSNEKEETNIAFLKKLYEYGYVESEDGAIVAFCKSFLTENKIHTNQAKEWIDAFLKTSFEYICTLAEISNDEQSFMEDIKKFKFLLDSKNYEAILKTINLDLPPCLEIADEKYVVPHTDKITFYNNSVTAFDGKIINHNSQEKKLFYFMQQLDKVLEQTLSAEETKQQFNKNYGNFLNKIARYNLKGLLSANDIEKLKLKLKQYSMQIHTWNMKPQTKENKSLFNKISYSLFKIHQHNSSAKTPNENKNAIYLSNKNF